MSELSYKAKQAIRWLLTTKKAGEMKVRDARQFIRDSYGKDVENELREFAKVE